MLYESASCVTAVLSKIVQNLKASSSPLGAQVVSSPLISETQLKIMEHAKSSSLVDDLCACLENAGTSLISGSSNLLRAACETCKAIWLLTEALEVYFIKSNTYLFPLSAWRSPSLSSLNIKEQERGSMVGKETTKIIDAVTRRFLTSKAMQVAFYYCLHQRLEAAVSAAIQASFLLFL